MMNINSFEGNTRVLDKLDENTYIQEQMEINGRHAFIYLIVTPIGDFHVVEYECKAMSLEGRKVFDCDPDKALAYYKSLCKKMIDGKI